MIITLEDDGQPWLDSSFDEKVPFDIVLPEQTYYPDTFHPVLRHINTGYATSISSGSDVHSVGTGDSHPAHLSISQRRKRWRLFNPRYMFKRRPPVDPPLSRSIHSEKPKRRKGNETGPFLLSDLARPRMIGWILLSVLICVGVAFGVWLAMRRAYRNVFPQSMNSEWSPDESNIYTLPPELFGCYDEPSDHNVNGSQFLMQVMPGQTGQHTFTIQGGASGHLTLASSPDPNSPAVIYDIVLQSNPSSLEKVVFQPPPGSTNTPSGDFLIDTPSMIQTSIADPPACMRFDITMYIPRNVRQLSINITTPVQITFSPQGHIELDNLSVVLGSNHPRTRVDTSESLLASSISVEMTTGLFQGPISLGDSTKIMNGGGEIQLDVIPNVSKDLFNPSTARFETISHGKVEIRYLWNRAYRKRPIDSRHTMGDDEDTGRFDYGCSGFNGLLYSNATHFNVTNLNYWTPKPATGLANSSWPTVVGNQTGMDRICIISGSGSIILPDNSGIPLY